MLEVEKIIKRAIKRAYMLGLLCVEMENMAVVSRVG
jgi:hypothetical protein